jgi:hypothetical protein
MSLAVVHTTAPATRRSVDVREVVAELRRRHPRAGEDRLVEMLVERLEEDRRLLLDAGRYLVQKVLAAAETRVRQSRAAPSPELRAERQAAEKAAVTALAAKVRGSVLDMLIGEKSLRDMTGAEVARLGVAFTRLASRVPPSARVGDCLSESQAAALIDLKAG